MNFITKFNDAKRFIDEGRAKDACGVLRPVLEKHLQSLCAEKGILTNKSNITGFIFALADAGAINRVQKSKFLNWLQLGNAGSHPGDEEITQSDAMYFLEGLANAVGVLLTQEPGPDSKPSVAIPKQQGMRSQASNEGNRKALIAAFYLSKFDHENLVLGNQGQTFTIIANLLSVKVNTLKHYRDRFDPHTGSYRKGWWQAELSPQFADILQEYKDHDETVLRKMVLGFIKQ